MQIKWVKWSGRCRHMRNPIGKGRGRGDKENEKGKFLGDWEVSVGIEKNKNEGKRRVGSIE